MLRLRHFFSRVALLPLAASALSGYVALSSMNLTIDSLDFWVLLVLGLGLGLVAWWSAARESGLFEAARLEAASDRALAMKLNESVNDLKGLVGALKVGEANMLPASVENLTDFSNLHLKSRVADFTMQMRKFGSERRRQSDALHSKWWPVPEGKWDQFVAQTTAYSNETGDLFNERFRSVALGLRDEMRSRLNLSPPYDFGRDDVALEYGMLAGPNPIEEAASHLEELARRLPNS